MDGAKKLTGLELDNYQYPLADVSHLSEEEKKELFKRGMCIPKQLNMGHRTKRILRIE